MADTTGNTTSTATSIASSTAATTAPPVSASGAPVPPTPAPAADLGKPSITQEVVPQKGAEPQAIQAANSVETKMTDPLTIGLKEPMKMAGQAVELPKSAEAPVSGPTAKPAIQIAPVSANGEQTSSRISPSADVPANAQQTDAPANVQNTEAGKTDSSVAPNDDVAPASSSPSQVEEALVAHFGKPLGSLPMEDGMQMAKSLMDGAPSRMRLY